MYIQLKKYDSICWICGNVADSDEHKFKKSDIVKFYGKGNYTKNIDFQPVHIKDTVTKISGPKSKKLTFEKVICKKCNNELSQPFDKSYEIFSDYVSENINDILQTQIIDFEIIFGQNWENEIKNLYKYFIKVFGCYISTANFEVSEKIISFLVSKTSTIEHLKLKFCIKPDIINLQKILQYPYHHLYYGTTKGIGESKKEVKNLWGWFTNSGVSIYWVYNISIEHNKTYKPFNFKKIEQLECLMSESLPKDLKFTKELIEFIENKSFDENELINSILIK